MHIAVTATDRTGRRGLHNGARVCVFAGSRCGANGSYSSAARTLGHLLVERELALVYGGSSRGLMGAIAAAVRDDGGEVIGIMPKALAGREVATCDLGELRTVGSMHERKALMSELADAFIALPGGFGTLDELFEIVTWAQIGLHHKPIGLLNVDGYFNCLLAVIDQAVAEGFVLHVHRELLIADAQPERLLDRMSARCG